MARPSADDIEQVYRSAEKSGLTRNGVDAIAKPLISSMGIVLGLESVRSHGELRAIQGAVASHIATIHKATVQAVSGDQPLATPRQVDYILSLLDQRKHSGASGGFMTGPADRMGIEALTRQQASTYITSLTERY